MTIKIIGSVRLLFLLILLILPHQTRSQTWKELFICANSLYYRGKIDSAITLGERSLVLAISKFGEIDTNVALVYQSTGRYYFSIGYQSIAEKYWNQALDISKRTVGKKHSLYAKTLAHFALKNYDNMRFEKAESLFVEAISLLEEVLGLYHIDVAIALNNYGAMLTNLERFADAERVYKNSFKIFKKICDPNDMYIAMCYGNLSVVYKKLGNIVESDSMREMCINIKKKNLPLGSYLIETFPIQADLAIDEWHKGNYNKAKSLFVYIIKTLEKRASGTEVDGSIGASLEYGKMLTEMKNYTLAESILVNAIKRNDYFNTLNRDWKKISLYNSLADLYSQVGRYLEAESLYHKSLASVNELFGVNTPLSVEVCFALSQFYRKQGDIEKATDYASKSLTIQLDNIRNFSSVMSEYRALLYVKSLNGMIDNYFSCFRDNNKPNVTEVGKAASLLLQSKGLVTEEIAGKRNLELEATNADVRTLVDSLKQVKHTLSGLFVSGPPKETNLSFRKLIDSLTKCSNMIESELALLSSEYRTTKTDKSVTSQTVASELPRGASLVEYFAYNYTGISNQTSERRYLVHYMNKSGRSYIHDLGPASRIDHVVHNYQIHFQNISKLNRPFSSTEEKEYAELSTQLYNLLWKPISKLVDKSKLVFIAPEGSINLVSFAGLVDNQGNYLIEKYPLQYLSVGRDIAIKKDRIHSSENLLVLGDPDFDATVADRLATSERMLAANEVAYENPYQARNIRSTCSSLHEINANPLSSSRSEVNTISDLFKIKNPGQSVTLMLGVAASEERLKKDVKNHRVIHIATHGYFIDGSCATKNSKRITDDTYAGENPLLLSGLLLAGANLHGAGADISGAEDGILTALEVSAMDLHGTNLVVLSACETGLGKIEQGEGVYGLRRAFQIAGARTVVSSLWQVPDRETTTFMKILYSQNAKTYPELFQKVAIQRLNELRIRKQSTHPYTWAGFIATGDWKIK